MPQGVLERDVLTRQSDLDGVWVELHPISQSPHTWVVEQKLKQTRNCHSIYLHARHHASPASAERSSPQTIETGLQIIILAAAATYCLCHSAFGNCCLLYTRRGLSKLCMISIILGVWIVH